MTTPRLSAILMRVREALLVPATDMRAEWVVDGEMLSFIWRADTGKARAVTLDRTRFDAPPWTEEHIARRIAAEVNK